MKDKKQKKDPFIKKIEKLYQNYGIDTTDMDEEEFERLKNQYKKNGKDIDLDLKNSEKHKDKFEDDVL